MNHPQIPRCYRYEESASERSLYLERIEGRQIDLVLPKRRKKREEMVVQYMLQLFDILIYLHSLSPPVFHLDIKPEHLIVSDRKLYLIDFGIAVREGEAVKRGIGTPGFAPPEQFQGIVHAGADLYAAGKTMEILLGTIAKDPLFAAYLECLTHPQATDRISDAKEARQYLLELQQELVRRRAKGNRALRRRCMLWIVLILQIIYGGKQMTEAQIIMQQEKEEVLTEALNGLATGDFVQMEQAMQELSEDTSETGQAIYRIWLYGAKKEQKDMAEEDLLDAMEDALECSEKMTDENRAYLLSYLSDVIYVNREIWQVNGDETRVLELLQKMERKTTAETLLRKIDICRKAIE